VCVQEVRRKTGGTEQAEKYIFLYEEGNEDISYRQFFFVQRIISAVRRLEFVCDRMSCIILRGCWCSIMVLNVHAPCEDKSDDVKDIFYEELGCVFEQFPRYYMKILLDYFSVNVDREDIFKPTIRSESSREIGNNNGVRVANFTTCTGIQIYLIFQRD
jgi:hypothetical protein